MIAPLRPLVRAFVFLFYKIKEPRIARLMQLGIYLCMIGAGHYVIAHPPSAYTSIIGSGFVFVFGGFLLFGGVAAAIAVLPGLWWLERIGVIALWTGLAVFAVVAAALGISLVGFLIAIALSFALVQRWSSITEFDLAPRAS